MLLHHIKKQICTFILTKETEDLHSRTEMLIQQFYRIFFILILHVFASSIVNSLQCSIDRMNLSISFT